MNPNLHNNKAFKEKVKGCLKNTFGPSTNIYIGKILLEKNTRVLALVIFDENMTKITRKMFRVLSCVIYTIIGKYVCIDYLGYEKSKVSDLRLGVTGRYKNVDTYYDNVLEIGIPDQLLNLLSCHGFSNNNESVVILKFPHRMSKYYFNKVFVIF